MAGKTKKSNDETFVAPPAPVDVGGPLPIGVPRGYVASVVRNVDNADQYGPGTLAVSTPVTPRYFDGDEYTPSTFASENQARIQLALKAAGLFTANEKFRLGTWDTNTRNAYRKLLEFANGSGMEWRDALRTYGAERAGQDEIDATQRAPLVRNPSDVAELTSTFETTYRSRTGYKPTPDRVQRMVSSYLSEEAAAQTAAYSMAETGGVLPTVTDSKLWAANFAEKDNPQGSFRQDAIAGMDEFYGLLGGVGDPAPTKRRVEDKGGMDPIFEAKLQALIAASGGRVSIKSGYRSVEQQSALWNAALAKYGSAEAARKWVAPPGHSNHNRGVAADLAGDLAWAHANAPRFGLAFPMAHEKWHVEPAGLKGASKKAYTTPPPQASGPAAVSAELGPSVAGLFAELASLLTEEDISVDA